MDTTANTLAVYRKEVKYLISLLDSVMRKGVSCAGHRMCRSKSPSPALRPMRNARQRTVQLGVEVELFTSLCYNST